MSTPLGTGSKRVRDALGTGSDWWNLGELGQVLVRMNPEKPNEHYVLQDESGRQTRLQRLGEQIPAIVVTVLLVGVTAAWLSSRQGMREQLALAPLREQNDSLRMQAEANRRDILATNELLRTAISRHEGELFKSDEELQKMNGERMNALASAIAEKVTPALPAPKTTAELAREEDEQIEKISTRTAEKIRPTLGEIGQNQQHLNATV